jgi:flagellar motor protein MotB
MNAEQFEDFSESLEPEELPHADERWLVSYADMMTLLFGLFVMLYAMVGRLEDVEKAARQQFAATGDAAAAPKEKSDQGLIALEERLRQMQIRTGEMQNTINQLEKSLADERARAQTAAAQPATQSPTLEALRKELDEARKERDSLRTEIAMARLGGSGESDGGRRTTGHGGAAQPRSANGATSKPQAAPALAGGPPAALGNENTKVKRDETGAPFNFTLEYESRDGGRQSLQIDRISPEGMQLKEAPQPGPQQRFNAQIKRDDGSSVEVTIVFGREPGGTLASRARIVELTGKNRDEFGQWLREGRAP